MKKFESKKSKPQKSAKLISKKTTPWSFVLDELEKASPYTKPMFGCTAVYVGERIVLVLRERESSPEDNGVWLATTSEHHESLKRDFPSMRSIQLFGPGPTGWQVLPSSDPDFEEAALKACKLILRGDARIGKVPSKKVKKVAKSKKR
jgi:hypothetical protein